MTSSLTSNFRSSPAEMAGFAALMRGRAAPDFSDALALGDDDRAILTMRGLDANAQGAAAAIWSSARSAVAAGRGLAFLRGLDADALATLQAAAGLADPIRPSMLGEEGAENLLLKPTEGVDRNHDGLLEIGVARTVAFPPPDATPSLRAAWSSTLDGLDTGDALTLALEVAGPATSIEGTGATRPGFSSPDFDWSGHIAALFDGVAVSSPYNSPEATRRAEARLTRFLDALKDHGLA